MQNEVHERKKKKLFDRHSCDHLVWDCRACSSQFRFRSLRATGFLSLSFSTFIYLCNFVVTLIFSSSSLLRLSWVVAVSYELDLIIMHSTARI